MKKLLYVLIAFTTLSACKKDEKTPEPTLQGNWELTSIVRQPNAGEPTKDDYPDGDYREYLSFENDGNVYFLGTVKNISNWTNDDIYTSTNNKITFTHENYFGDNVTYSINGSTLTITEIYSDITYVYTYKKSDFDVKKAYTEYNLPK
ncbi:hypothetical protein [Pseudopedobacter beijingensis]|uniref:Lipocalin-like domain-containing protein n=1 Tax=Pseudopedobacter beijingensis TaxID=1207056 RepID=A0ABW4IFS4_9SPHI